MVGAAAPAAYRAGAAKPKEPKTPVVPETRPVEASAQSASARTVGSRAEKGRKLEESVDRSSAAIALNRPRISSRAYGNRVHIGSMRSRCPTTAPVPTGSTASSCART